MKTNIDTIMRSTSYEFMKIIEGFLPQIDDYEQACFDKGLCADDESFFQQDYYNLDAIRHKLKKGYLPKFSDRNEVRLVIKSAQKLATVLGLVEKEDTDGED